MTQEQSTMVNGFPDKGIYSAFEEICGHDLSKDDNGEYISPVTCEAFKWFKNGLAGATQFFMWKAIDGIRSAEDRINPIAIDNKSAWCNAYCDEVLELRAHIALLQQKLVASESLYKSYKEDSKRMYRNSCKNYQEKIDNLEKKIHELESPAKHEAGQRCNHYKCEKCFNQSPQIISKESWDNACNGLGGNRG